MDIKHFDDLTRSMVGSTGTRRLLLLGGGALGGVIARFGLGEIAAAKKKHSKRHDDHQRSGQVQAAGKKHKNNNKHKDKKKGKDKPKSCPSGFRRCNDSSCIADTSGICCLDEEFCPGGGCRSKDGCCPGEKKCNGKCSPTGDGGCCPEEKPCGDDCIPKSECCDQDTPLCPECKDYVCNSSGQWECRERCLDDEVCRNRECVVLCDNECVIDDASGECTKAPEGKVYCEGHDICVNACPPGKVLDVQDCRCWPVCTEECGDNEICCHGQCVAQCTNGCDISIDCRSCVSAPGKGHCIEKGICVDATCPPGQRFDQYACKCLPRCGDGVNCGDGCCPGGEHAWWCERPGVCCRGRLPEEGQGLICECASGYSSCPQNCCKD